MRKGLERTWAPVEELDPWECHLSKLAPARTTEPGQDIGPDQHPFLAFFRRRPRALLPMNPSLAEPTCLGGGVARRAFPRARKLKQAEPEPEPFGDFPPWLPRVRHRLVPGV